MLLPVFAPDENSYPESVGPVTSEMYREHQKTGTTINDEQLAALAKMKQHTDFNDLANKSALGQEGVDRQVRSVLNDLMETHNLKMRIRQKQTSIHLTDSPKTHRSASLA